MDEIIFLKLVLGGFCLVNIKYYLVGRFLILFDLSLIVIVDL